MANRTEEGEIIRGPISDVRLSPGIQRMRSGSNQLFGERIVRGGKLVQECDFEITPPQRSWYSKEIEGVWMWVEGCDHCNGNVKPWSYVRCEKHDVCVDCRVPRAQASTTPSISGGMGAVWGCEGGWRCNTCQESLNAERLAAAEARIIPEEEYDEWDFYNEDEAKCPWCKAEICTDESYDAESEECECPECERKFTLTAVHSVTWTTKRKHGGDHA